MSLGRSGITTSRWGPYALAGVLIFGDFCWLARGLSHTGPDYQVWSLNHALYSDIINLGFDHYVRGHQFIHPLPYLHDRIEYPVLLGFAMWLPTWLPGGPATWFAVAGVMAAGATWASIALVQRRHPPAAWWIAASPALLLTAGINWDLIGIMFLVGGVVWFGERRYRLSGVATALGTCFKLFPVVVAPMAVSALGAHWWRSLAPAAGPGAGADRSRGEALARWIIPFAAVSAVLAVPLLVLAPSNTLWFIRFNSLRPQKDSVWEVAQRVFGTSLMSNHAINTASLLVVVAATAYGAWMVWRIREVDQARAVALASAMVIIVWMAVNKIWNPQYALWVFAAGALACLPARFGVTLGGIAVLDYGFEFVLRRPDQPNSFSWVGYGLLAARSVLFVLMAAWVVGELRRLATGPAITPVDAAVRSPA